MSEAFDPRVTPVREDLAAAHLKDRFERPRYAKGQARRVGVPVLALSFAPGAAARRESELLFGEPFNVYDEADGWAWGQSVLDGYVGWVETAGLTGVLTQPTHLVAVAASHLYPGPDLKLRPLARLSFASQVAVAETADGYCRIAGGWLFAKHLAAFDSPVADYVTTGLGLLGVPYLWGGRSSLGLDCSGFIQLVLQRAGIDCPRDTDQQALAVGETLVGAIEPAQLRHGDLVFFPGHVGIVLDGGRFLHANAFDMAVTVHELDAVLARAEASGLPASGVRRIWRDGAPPLQ